MKILGAKKLHNVRRRDGGWEFKVCLHVLGSSHGMIRQNCFNFIKKVGFPPFFLCVSEGIV